MTSTAKIDRQLIIEELFAGRVIGITAREATVQLDNADESFGIQYNGYTYGAGEVGELLVFEGRSNLVVGLITSVHEEVCDNPQEIRRIAKVSLLATACFNTGNLKIGVSNFPRIGARVFCVPIGYLKDLHEHTKDEKLAKANDNEETSEKEQQDAEVKKANVASDYTRLGTLQNFNNIPFKISLSKLMNRHCGIFGATGGGKTFTAAKLIEAVVSNENSKVIIIDPTGDYENFVKKISNVGTRRICIGGKPSTGPENVAYLTFDLLSDAVLYKLFQPNESQKPYFAKALTDIRMYTDDPKSEPILSRLNDKIIDVCRSEHHITGELICTDLIERIQTILDSPKFREIVRRRQASTNAGEALLKEVLDKIIKGECDHKILLLSCKYVSSLFGLKNLTIQIIADYLFTGRMDNYIGKLDKNGDKKSEDDSIFLLLDEAHNFISPDSKEISKEFNAFERIAREGRKIGLNLCLVTQCPQDLPEVVLNQLGTVIVHRLSGDHDRKLMERSCGDIDVSALSSLPILGTGQAVVLGTNFPIPVVVNVDAPINKPGFIV